MSTGVPRRVRDKDGKRRALLEAATEVFAERGFEAAATKEIAQRAGCSESLIFRYFGDKQGIFEQAVSQQITEAEDKVAESMPDNLADYIEALFHARLLVHGKRESVPGWDIAGRALSDRKFSLRVFLPNHQRRVAVIAEGLRHYQELGQVTPGIDIEVLAELLANFISVTTSLSPRWFGTSKREIRAQIELGARIFATGSSVKASDDVKPSPIAGKPRRAKTATPRPRAATPPRP